jgi:membrane-associated phospholipid phosphatase
MKRSSPFLDWVIAILIAALAIAVAFHFDQSMLRFIAHHQNRKLFDFARIVSRLGDWPEHFVLGLVLAGAAWMRASKKWTRIFLSMLVALSIAGVTGRAIKITTGRARPSVKAEEVWNGPRLGSKFHAFPSGHVAASAAFFAVLFLASWRIGLLCSPIPILIACSRMYLSAHYLSDVVCAAVLGLICAVFVARWLLPSSRTKHEAQRRG